MLQRALEAYKLTQERVVLRVRSQPVRCAQQPVQAMIRIQGIVERYRYIHPTLAKTGAADFHEFACDCVASRGDICQPFRDQLRSWQIGEKARELGSHGEKHPTSTLHWPQSPPHVSEAVPDRLQDT
jgi:hypothetical protein